MNNVVKWVTDLFGDSSRKRPINLIIPFKSPGAENPNASHAGLGVTANNTAAFLTAANLPALAVPVTDGYFLQAGLSSGLWGDVTHVVLAAPFFDTPFLKGLCTQFPGIKFACNFHSNVGFLAVDNWSTKVLLEQITFQKHNPNRNFVVGSNCEKFQKIIKKAFSTDCALLPNLYVLPKSVTLGPKWDRTEMLRIGCFGAQRVLKNIPTAAWATLIMAKKLNTPAEFHISKGREEGAGAKQIVDNLRQLFLNNPQVTLVEDSWEDWETFRSLVHQMHLLLQPSFTESFNGVTADGIAEGVPSVVGEAIDWVPDEWIANADDAGDIAKAGLDLISDYPRPAKQGLSALRWHNSVSLDAWKVFLKRNIFSDVYDKELF